MDVDVVVFVCTFLGCLIGWSLCWVMVLRPTVRAYKNRCDDLVEQLLRKGD